MLETGATTEQKAQVIRGLTQVMVDVLNKDPANVHVIIEEVPPTNWGLNYESIAARRATAARADEPATR
jgi:4-oxalocrotonate tautomerase